MSAKENSISEKVGKANLANIIKKVQAGKTLSRAELALIESHDEGKGKLFDTMHQAAAAMGLEVEILKRAKAAGCGAFKAGARVNQKELSDWLTKNPEKVSKQEGDLKEQKIFEEIRKLKLANDLKAGKLQNAADMAQWLSSILIDALQSLEQKLVNEYPAQVEMLDIASIRIRSKKLNDEVREKLNKLVK